MPLCLYYHPKVIAAASIQMAAMWRRKKGLDCGIPLVINGHPWYKWIDSSIEEKDNKEVIGKMRNLYINPN